MRSPAWSNQDYPITAHHGQEATWIADRNTCALYAYAWRYGVEGCVHPGVDISMPDGTPIHAIRGGRVVRIRNVDKPGLMEVVVQDGDQEQLYTHLSRRDVRVGQIVEAGQRVGASGTFVSPHLHFEHRVRDSRTEGGWRIVDPVPLLTSTDEPIVREPKEPEPMITMKSYTMPGAKRSLYLPAHIPVQIKIVHHANVRSYQKFTAQTHSTFHDTGNPRTKAQAEYAWLAGGRSGVGAGGYQAIVDDTVIIICVPFDEVTWHAGTAEGNRVSWGVELAFGGDTNWNTALEHACALHGAMIEMQGLNPNTAAVLHQVWYGKWCSAQVLNRGIWSTVKAKITAYANAAKAARSGHPVPTPSVYAAPVLPTIDGKPWDGTTDAIINGTKLEGQRTTAKTTSRINRRKWAHTDSPETDTPLDAGVSVELLGWVAGEKVNDISEWWIDTTGHRLWAGGIDATPKQDPAWPIPPEKTPGVVPVNGHLYYPFHDEATGELGRTISIHRDGNLHKWADTGSAVLGPVTAGDERVFRYWTRGTAVPLYEGGPDEVIWYAEDLHTGARMWAGLSDERPD